MENNHFIVIVPVYNAEKWIGKCIESILVQDYNDFNLLVVDDCSTDNTWRTIQSYGIDCHKNAIHTGSALANLVYGVNTIALNSEDIIVTIDGDDWLYSTQVFSYLNEVYQEDVWLTYGQYKPLSERFKYACQDLSYIKTPGRTGALITVSVTPSSYRKSGLWVTSHLRTFKKWLWDKIDDKDLRDLDGEYFKVAWDLAFMYPMIEMADTHIRFIDKLLYIYNDLNPNCDGTINPEWQTSTGQYIQSKQCYDTL